MGVLADYFLFKEHQTDPITHQCSHHYGRPSLPIKKTKNKNKKKTTNKIKQKMKIKKLKK